MRRVVVFVHRWLGVAVSVPVCLWFLSGIGMMYFDFPEIAASDRVAHATPLSADQVRLSPRQALSAAFDGQARISSVRLDTVDGRPVYRAVRGGRQIRVFADTGEAPGTASIDAVRRVAAQWAGHPAADARLEAVTAVDQWTVQGSLRTMRPLWKVSWPGGDEVYVSGVSGEVVQATTRASRLRAYLGPIPHWLYFTTLRQHPALWTDVVDGVASLACATAIVGLILGVSARFRYRGTKRWHVVLGLVFGVAAVTWTFSGLLSMDPFPSLAESGPSDAASLISSRLRGRLDVNAISAWNPQAAIAALPSDDVREIELILLDGRPVSLATLGDGSTRIVPLDGAPAARLEPERLAAVVKAASPGTEVLARLLVRYDAYYLDRRGRLPLPVLLVTVEDAAHTRLYIDPATARLVGSYQTSDWAHRWLYHGLHSLDFPSLYAHRPAWDVVVMIFMLGGAALSTTSIVLSWRVLMLRLPSLGRRVATATSASPMPPRSRT